MLKVKMGELQTWYTSSYSNNILQAVKSRLMGIENDKKIAHLEEIHRSYVSKVLPYM